MKNLPAEDILKADLKDADLYLESKKTTLESVNRPETLFSWILVKSEERAKKNPSSSAQNHPS